MFCCGSAQSGLSRVLQRAWWWWEISRIRGAAEAPKGVGTSGYPNLPCKVKHPKNPAACDPQAQLPTMVLLSGTDKTSS